MPNSTRVPRIGYQKILYTTDLSEAGRYAFPHAASLARIYGADLTVFHVLETKEFEKFLTSYINDDLWDEIKHRNLAEAREILINRKREDSAIKNSVEAFYQDAETEDASEPYITYDVVVDMGDPVEKIVEYAHENDFDLVIIGRHGHGLARSGLMGDTARSVMRRCTIPVMVVTAPD